MDGLKKIVLNIFGLILIGALTFKKFASHSNIIGPMAIILVLGPHIKA